MSTSTYGRAGHANYSDYLHRICLTILVAENKQVTFFPTSHMPWRIYAKAILIEDGNDLIRDLQSMADFYLEPC